MGRYNEAFSRILPELKDLSPEDRVEVFSLLAGVYCSDCGYEQPKHGRRCQCENDE